MKTKIIVLLSMLFISQGAFAHCEKKNYYVGAGVAFNSIDQFDDSTGMQFMGGYCLDLNFMSKKSKTAVEVGYMKSGDFENTVTRTTGGNGNNQQTRTSTNRRSYDGLWATGVTEYRIDPKFHFIARLGMDIGDDNGLLYGLGAAFNVTKWSQVRAEIVERDTVGSLQLNWVSDFE